MIRQVTDKAEINCKKLLETCAGKRILSNLEAYGTDYDFCRFYISDSDSVLLFMNDTLLISGDGFEKDELSGFAGIHTPFRIEGIKRQSECFLTFQVTEVCTEHFLNLFRTAIYR